MTPEQFCYWLQGYTEMGGPAPTPEQWQAIKDHLQSTLKPLILVGSLPSASVPPLSKAPVYWKPEITC